jgi:hypothetical protein
MISDVIDEMFDARHAAAPSETGIKFDKGLSR